MSSIVQKSWTSPHFHILLEKWGIGVKLVSKHAGFETIKKIAHSFPKQKLFVNIFYVAKSSKTKYIQFAITGKGGVRSYLIIWFFD